MNTTCPQCGFVQDIGMAKLSQCASCGVSFLLENTSTSLSDLKVDIMSEKYLFKLGNVIRLKNTNYLPQGYSVYLHDEGFQIEWELIDEENNISYLNQEDESLFLVKPVASEQAQRVWESLQPNTHASFGSSEWLVVEKRLMRFSSFGGRLVNIPLLGVDQKCTYLSNTSGECLVFRFQHDAVHERYEALQGWWLDPMELAHSK